MKLDRNFRMDEMTAPKGERYGLDTVFVDRAGGTPLLVATNGYALVALKVALEEHDTANWIDPRVFAEVRKATTGRVPVADVEANGKAVIDGPKNRGVTIPTPELPLDAFPDWRQVAKVESKTSVRISLDPKLLLQVVAAMGSPKYIVLEIATSEKNGKSTLDPIRVRSTEAPEVDTALLMPVRLED